MIRWNNDYNHGAHPAVLEAFAKTNDEGYGGYGLDEWCEKASEEIKKHLGNANAQVHFLVGGTQANYTIISAALRPYESVVCADSGHIHAHETGAVEHIGHKIHALPGTDGKITAEQVRTEAENYRTSGVQEHITQPKMVYLSFPTEFGTIYSRQELEDIHQVCKEYDLYLFIDGARMAYGLGSCKCDLTLADLAALADVFYIGGTKCGAMFGEAVVIVRDELKNHFRSHIKQNGGMLAKGWTLGLQFYALFKDGLYFEIGKTADAQAMRIKEAFARKGIPAYIESFTNQQFVVINQEQMDKLAQKHVFEYQEKLKDDLHCVRFCASWSTKEEDLEVLLQDIGAL
ncbi:MAG: aminotransferase class V-fold PLP-dependent enzyme [Lachnospiraceae bacterium]|nr:aminotransferase class V-fold PLP-dependent enzyme [Lachnospiraceae bacterium]